MTYKENKISKKNGVVKEEHQPSIEVPSFSLALSFHDNRNQNNNHDFFQETRSDSTSSNINLDRTTSDPGKRQSQLSTEVIPLPKESLIVYQPRSLSSSNPSKEEQEEKSFLSKKPTIRSNTTAKTQSTSNTSIQVRRGKSNERVQRSMSEERKGHNMTKMDLESIQEKKKRVIIRLNDLLQKYNTIKSECSLLSLDLSEKMEEKQAISKDFLLIIKQSEEEIRKEFQKLVRSHVYKLPPVPSAED